jgi:hypothetical protein
MSGTGPAVIYHRLDWERRGGWAFTIMRLMGHSAVTVSSTPHKFPTVSRGDVAGASQVVCFEYARVAKSADATDLKSVFPQGECGFNSHPGHQ